MFIERLLMLCGENSLDLTGLLKKMGLSTSKGTAWRNGSIPNGKILSLLASFFDVSTDYLLGSSDIKKPAPTNGDELSPELLHIMERVQLLSPDNQSKLSELIDLFLNSQGNK